MNIKLDYNETNPIYDEMFTTTDKPREHYKDVFEILATLGISEFKQKEVLAKLVSINQGITFTVYSDGKGIERIFPFDLIPRIIRKMEWDTIEQGLQQRIKALNLFLTDIYSSGKIIKDKIIPGELVYTCPDYIQEMVGVHVPHNIYTHISGIDIIRDADGEYYVLEDNLRTPSGISYVLENRIIMKRIFPEIFKESSVLRVDSYPALLHDMLMQLAPFGKEKPTIVLLTPGVYNSAYYEHIFLASQMGIQLVESYDLIVSDYKVYMKTIEGLKQVDVIYKRVDDSFIDPLVFRKDSVLGVPGLFESYKRGNVVLVNAIGNGVADDKAVYSYVPDMIQYYLNEKPILKNIPTYRMGIEEEREEAFKKMDTLVVKATNQSGGYGMLIGRDASPEEIEKYKKKIMENPRNYIAQPTINLSTAPCFFNGTIEPRHIDLRPFAIYSPNGIKLIPGGLTRVALKKGSLVVNSSQGGGSKDTWVVS
ncbi:MAG TPA: circularly permuted type 2 ATP-grasp protein [Leptospiraceae bacterium]|nr:circularly permuted type 2 ATP-grasp protein [Leptospiraceae bacterium]HMW03459.1 circularly permuted type 2 ATP-grasp protein [Leptospiraceae bacterium]HMX31592.1 circularly permuted type 2 ATP-grasp protein [Leptospiraceae bacterium]HMY29621.1 circularly permuted type 2 ATP-grasp protein [Leptospiraceae bacterium]HMZ62889.1 circularly permuted type 2 ATP-grasp protein [Leptospiraceae bacterium]